MRAWRWFSPGCATSGIENTRFVAGAERFTPSVAKLNGGRLDIQAFARCRPLPRRQNPRIHWKDFSMGLFRPDLYRAFFLGFGVTALAMGALFVPHLV